MRLLRLHLQAYGPFTDRWITFAPTGLHLIHGPNEAGKSSLLRALVALRFGIEHRSSDNFLHEHARMAVAGVFVDGRGEALHLVRRKGRGQTLGVRADDGSVQPASVAVEQALTGGLTRADYEAMFGLDHGRLRVGGEALLAGQGDVGAALFEASAGLRSLPQVGDALDAEARRLFVPGARGRNGRINEALRRHDDCQRACRDALLRPADWAERRRAQLDAGEALRGLLARQAELQHQCDRWREWLAVAPLLQTLDGAAAWLAEHGSGPVLDETAESRRVEIETALAALQRDIAALQAQIAAGQSALAALPVPEAVLAAAAAVDRLVARGDALDRLAREAGALAAAGLAAQAHRQACARALDPQASTTALRERRPTPQASAEVEAGLADVERAEQALALHRTAVHARQDDAVADEAAQADGGGDAVVPEIARAALRGACEAAAAARTVLARLEALPVQHAAVCREVAEAQRQLGLDPAATVAAPQLLLDAEIDQAQRRLDEPHTLIADQHLRVREIDVALRRQRSARDRLLAAGPVPTPDDVQAARGARDALWGAVRGGAGDAADAFEAAMRRADALADAFAHDSARAAELQALQRTLADLEHDRAQRLQDIARLVQGAEAQARDWAARLTAAGLPVREPAALREWQARWRQMRERLAHAEALATEREQAEQLARQVRLGLVAALRLAVPPGVMPFDEQAPLTALLALARQVESRQAQREQLQAAQAGARQARQRQLRRDQAETVRLQAARDAAGERLREAVAGWSLTDEPSAAAVRARLQAWVDWAAADAAVARIEQDLAARQAERAQIDERAAQLAQTLGESPPEDLRGWIDALADRLARARAVDQQRERLAQSLRDAQTRLQAQTVALQQQHARLDALCREAGVVQPGDLPAQEARSRAIRARRQAQAQAAQLLAQASAQSPDALRVQLGAVDRNALAAELQRGELALADLAQQIDQARARDEQARRALDALDTSDAAAQAREGMERAAAAIRADLGPWLRARLAQALLNRARRTFRERAQGPMLAAASRHFAAMTGGQFVRLVGDFDADVSRPVLRAHRQDGREIGVEAMSEGTRDQLYLALRLAAWGLQRERGLDLPVVLDDVLMTADDGRALRMLGALADFAADAQVLVFTHHRHLLDLVRQALPAERVVIQEL